MKDENVPEPENLVLQILREMRAEMATKTDIARLEGDIAGLKGNIARLEGNIADVRFEAHSLRGDVASDLRLMEKRLGERIAMLNRAVMQYHASAMGHGILYSELEDASRAWRRE